MEHHNEVVPQPLMTLRVSRDGGRTWSPVREFWPDDCGFRPWDSQVWPPCACPRHRQGSEISQ